MNNITREDIKTWAHNPVTRYVLRQADEAMEKIAKRSKLNRESVQETALRCAYDEGLVKGLDLLKEAYIWLEKGE